MQHEPPGSARSTRQELHRRLRPATVVLSLVFLATALGAPSGVSAQDAEVGVPCVDGWQEVPLPDSATGAIPHEILVRDGEPAWLLGGSNDGPLAFRWQDGSWLEVRVRGKGAMGLMGADDASADRMWVVGYDKSSTGGLKPVIGTLTDGRFRAQSIPKPSGRFSLTDAVSTDAGTTVVGHFLDGGMMQAYARTRSGKRWGRPVVLGLDGEAALSAATTTPAGVTWAVGWRQAGAGQWRPLIARAGTAGKRAWKVQRGARLPAGQAVLLDVEFPTEQEGYAVGYLVPRGESRYVPVLERFEAGTWTQSELPWADDASAVLRAVSVGPSGLWIAGTRLPTPDAEAQAFTAHLRDGAWELSVPSAAAGRSDGWTIAATDAGAIAAIDTDIGIVALATCAASPASGGSSVAATAPARSAQLPISGPAPAEPIVVRSGAIRLRDVAADVGLGELTDTYGGLVADLDGDGWQDVFYSRHFDLPAVALGGPDGFRQPERYAFDAIDRHHCAAADIDADGRIDVFCAVGRAKGRILHRDDLVSAPVDAEGVVRRDAAGAQDPFGRGRFAVFLRLDDDEYPELFITTSPDRVDGAPGTNRFFRNVAGTFVPAPELGLDASTGGACAFAADVDGDGDEDLLHCVEYPSDGKTAGLRVYRNDEGILRDRTRQLKVRPMKDIAAAVADINGDRWPDLVQLSSTRLRVSFGSRAGFTEALGQPLTKGKALAVGDVDGDGSDDLYVARASSSEDLPDVVLLSRPSPVGLKVRQLKLPAVDGNADAVIAIDHDQNGLMDFLVLNGRQGERGPVQLMAAERVER